MTVDPEIFPVSPEENALLSPEPPIDPVMNPLSIEPLSMEPGTDPAAETLEPAHLWAEPDSYEPTLQWVECASVPATPREVPNLGHTLALIGLTAIFWFIAEILCFAVAAMVMHSHDKNHIATLAKDPRFIVPSEAIGYGLTFGIAAVVFAYWWKRPFLEGIHWNWASARRWAFLLAGVGLALGFSMSFFGSFLPMPKDPPIVKDLMSTPTGAWLMFVFATTGAPFFEEFVFRGFLLPSLINGFRWMGRREILTPSLASQLAIPVSVVLTTLPFALMHAAQVSSAWGPLVLIAVVSICLCITRLWLNSLAASIIVHSAYNFTLFAGILVSTGGFRHLDKLAG